jgi:hypothetical protein
LNSRRCRGHCWSIDHVGAGTVAVVVYAANAGCVQEVEQLAAHYEVSEHIAERGSIVPTIRADGE